MEELTEQQIDKYIERLWLLKDDPAILEDDMIHEIAGYFIRQLEKPVVQKIAEERFYADGTNITGYYAIYDRTDEDKTIWIDCPNNYLSIIVKALNSNFSA